VVQSRYDISKTRRTGFFLIFFVSTPFPHLITDGFPSFGCQVKHASEPRSLHVAGPTPHLAGPGACLLHRSSRNTPGGRILLEEEPLSSRATNYNWVSRYIEIASFINQDPLGIQNDFILINHRVQIEIDYFQISRTSPIYKLIKLPARWILFIQSRNSSQNRLFPIKLKWDGYFSQCSIGLRAGRPGDLGSIPGRGEKILPLASVCRRAVGPPSLLYNGYRSIFSWD
jgi:hypothetical protein